MRRTFSLFMATLSLTAFAAQTPQWTNPLVPQRADPHVSLHEGDYLMAATVPAYDAIELRRASSIAGLGSAEPVVIWRKRSSGPMSHHIWAPELHRIDGTWYVYFAAGEAERIWNIRMYVLACDAADPLAGPWREMGRIDSGIDTFSLDATTFVHRGQRYMLWAQNEPPNPGTGLFIARMRSPTELELPAVCISRPELPWERRGHNVNEGPAVLVRNGRVLVAYSASATDANYCLGLLHAPDTADLLDPSSWTKLPEPVFVSDRDAGQFGPGHNSFTTTQDGALDLIVYHARSYETIEGDPLNNPDRATRAQVLRWRDDGLPEFGRPVKDGPYRVSP